MEDCKSLLYKPEGGVGKRRRLSISESDYARNGKKVLLVDADPQGSLTVSLG
jgi:chromosome partitioning protein